MYACCVGNCASTARSPPSKSGRGKEPRVRQAKDRFARIPLLPNDITVNHPGVRAQNSENDIAGSQLAAEVEGIQAHAKDGRARVVDVHDGGRAWCGSDAIREAKSKHGGSRVEEGPHATKCHHGGRKERGHMAQLKMLEHGSRVGMEMEMGKVDLSFIRPWRAHSRCSGGVVVCLTNGDDVGKRRQGSQGLRWSLHK